MKQNGEPQRYSWERGRRRIMVNPRDINFVTQKKKKGEPQRYRW